MDDATTIIDDKVRQSVTIGLNPSGTFESNERNNECDGVGFDKNISHEYRSARLALQGTGKLPISIDNKCLTS